MCVEPWAIAALTGYHHHWPLSLYQARSTQRNWPRCGRPGKAVGAPGAPHKKQAGHRPGVRQRSLPPGGLLGVTC